MPALGAQDLHLWLCCRDLVSSSDDLKRRVLSRYAAVAPADWQFVITGEGKPALAGAERALDFNLSHSRDWLACAVTAGTAVGVDMEFCQSARATLKLARRFFREEEVVTLQEAGAAGLRNGFYDFWTLKEAAVKARGEALVPALRARGFRLTFPTVPEPGGGRIEVTTATADTGHYCLLDPLADYRVAICWLPDTPSKPRLRVFEQREGGQVFERMVPLRASSTLE